MKKSFFLCMLAILYTSLTFAQFTKFLDFTGAANGKYPWGVLVSDGTFLYGTTEVGGANDLGTIFKIKPDGTGFTKILDFDGAVHGSLPRGSLYYDGTFLYGLTYNGGLNGPGTVFKIKPDGSGFMKLLDMDGTNTGANSEVAGSLISDGTYLYGVTTWGGATNEGTVFRIKPDATGYLRLHQFVGATSGRNPFGAVYSDGTYLYGTTSSGGANNLGLLYKLKTDGTIFSNILEFAGSNGSRPYGAVISDGTYLYGMTQEGGTSNNGIVYKIKPDGTGFLILKNFTIAPEGTRPLGSLILQGGKLYGMTTEAGQNGDGIIFKINTDGSNYLKLYDFTGVANAGGSFPRGSLYSDGTYLYGLTTRGGSNDFGIIFRQAIPTSIEGSVKEEEYFMIYPNPCDKQITISIHQPIKDAQLEIYNAVGNMVFKQSFEGKTAIINTENFPGGMYFIRLLNSANSECKRLIVL
jgi:uncharacterized repeat protein (TIGR03803 family)